MLTPFNRLWRLLRGVSPRVATGQVAGVAVTWLDRASGDGAMPGAGRTAAMACPNCGAVASKSPVLAIRFNLGGSERHNQLLRCTDCTCLFYEDRSLPDYAEDFLVGQGRVAFYVQQGAGLGLLAGVLGQVLAPPGATYLEVGCGFGFALDFAVRARGWTGVGIDPGGMAAIGAGRLDLRIERRYLNADESALSGANDVVMAAETIEHVSSPVGFLRVLRGVLRPGGVVVLTTPDAAHLRPETATGAIVALLSPGYHLVFQTVESLTGILHEAGFTQVQVRQDGYGLVAHASDSPLRLERDTGVARAGYLDYLRRRAADFPVGEDLRLGLLGRLLQESMNDGDVAGASAAYAGLREACLARFGFDLDSLNCVPAAALECDLEGLVRIMPLALGGILHADALRRLALGAARESLEGRFLCAAEAADTLRRVLRQLETDDAMSEEIAWSARAEALLCATAAGGQDVVDRLLSLPSPPAGGEGRRREILRRGFVTLVNAGSYPQAAVVAAAAEMRAWADALERVTEADRDALFCLAVLSVRADEPSGWHPAVAWFKQVRRSLPDHTAPLFWPAARGEAMGLERLGDHVALAALLSELTERGIVLPTDMAERTAALGMSCDP